MTLRQVAPLTLLLACAGGSDPAKTPPATGAAAPATPTTPAPIPARHDDPTPDPITRPLSEADARSEASRLARAAFTARKDIVDADGKPVSTPDFPPAAFVGGLEGGRWKLRIEPPAGSWARVSFGAFGEHEQVEVGFASE